MSVGVFEPEVQDAPVHSDSGAKEIRAGTVALLVFFVGFGGWAAFAPLDAAVVAPGVVVVSGNRETLAHPQGGVISRIGVRDGDRVRHGQVLIELGDPEVLSQEQALVSQVVDLQMQRARLIAEQTGSHILTRPPEWAALSDEDRAFANAAYNRQVREIGSNGPRNGAWSVYEARVAGYRGEIAAINRQESLLNDELTRMRALADEQLVPITRVRDLERAMADLQGRSSELSAQIASTQQDRDEALRTDDGRLAQLAPQLEGARQRLEQTRLRAPVDGSVVGLAVHNVGDVVRPGERVLDIVPEGQELIIDAQVRPEDADDLRAGQPTEVRITAFRGRNLPIVHGVLRRFSADRLTDERTGRAYFLAEVAVPPNQLRLLAAPQAGGRRLMAGLPAQVIIPTRKRTALQYLLEPINQALWRSMREG